MYRRLSITIALILTSTSPALAQTGAAGSTVATFNGAGANAWASNVRASDNELVTLLADGVKKSATLRGLTERLSKSDVIVYVRPDVLSRNANQGHLSFLSSSGGYRYLVVHLPVGQSKQQQIAMLGHELQHAVVIADAASVTDSDTLRKEFERIGKVTMAANGRDFSFDSQAATDARQKILREMSDGPAVASAR
ncbi:MAG TPA: hypothetical protein VH436_20225 [Vicinamibacterales bacterium]|jgi:hypothetical protein